MTDEEPTWSEPIFAILYDDPDHQTEIFCGEDAEQSAKTVFKERTLNWSCYLFINYDASEASRKDLETKIAYAEDAANKGDKARLNAMSMEERINAELVEALDRIISSGFDQGYYCQYCNAKTYGLGDKMTCDHKPDCDWVNGKQALANAQGVKAENPHIHKWKPLSSDPECSDICECGAEKTIHGKIYKPLTDASESD